MLKQYLLLLLGLIVAVQSHEICNFEKHMCRWSNLHSCHFVHEKNKPLAGEKGYLYISKNTCKGAGIFFYIERYIHKFQLHYFINGTGNGIISVSANYVFSGRNTLWSCTLNQGTQWQKADIYVFEQGVMDILRHIYIEAFIKSGDMTIAIGNISSEYSEHPMQSCPPAPRITNKPTIRTTITKKPPPKPTTVLKTTSSIITSPAKSKGKNHTLCSFTLHLCKWRDVNYRCHFKHVKDTPLLGETGYLMLSKDTCNQASLIVRLKEYNFQLHYLMNGTGDMFLSLGVLYGFSGKVPVWSCSTSQGPKWQKVDIKVHLIHFDPRISVVIDAKVKGDATIAIGNIVEAGNGVTEKKCPSRLGHISTTPSILPESSSTNPELASSSSISSSRSSSSRGSSAPLSSHQSSTVTNHVETKSESKLNTPTINTESVTDHIDQKGTTSKPARIVTEKDHRKPSLTTVLGQPTNPQVESRTKSEDIIKADTTHRQKISMSNSGSVMGGSVVAAIVVVAVTVFSIFM